MLCKWEALPDTLRTDAVRPYYDVLRTKRGALVMKRLFDLVVSFLMILLLSPLLLLLIVLIKCDDPGPAFFRQERVTQYGRSFRIFKFRTMVVDADRIGAQVTSQNDARITRIGLKLRDCRLDELPQLFNIFLGDMSFVGTRPEVPKYVSQYSAEMMATLLLPAGVTSLASIMYKDESEIIGHAEDPDTIYVEKVLPEKMRYNLESLENFSIRTEFGLLFKTVAAVLGE